jgi:hypothetical protein
LLIEITSLKLEVAMLQAENADLKSRLNQNSSNSSKPPSSDYFNRKPAFQKNSARSDLAPLSSQNARLQSEWLQKDTTIIRVIQFIESCEIFYIKSKNTFYYALGLLIRASLSRWIAKSERLAWAKQKRAEFKNPALYNLCCLSFTQVVQQQLRLL